MGKESACKAGDTGNADSIPGSGRSPGEGNGNPLWHSFLKNPWTEEAGRLQFKESQGVGHNWVLMHADTTQLYNMYNNK